MFTAKQLDRICDSFDAYDRAAAKQNARFDAYVADMSAKETAKAEVEAEFVSVNAFLSYLADDERTSATLAEVSKLVQRTKLPRADVVKALRAAGVSIK